MGTGKQSIIEGGGKGKDNEAEVTGQALHVRVVAGGGGGGPSSDVNIAEVSGVAIGPTVPVSGTVSVVEPVSVDDNGGSLTVDGTVAVSAVGGTVTIQEPLSVDDNGGSLTVDGTVAVSAVGGTVTVGGTVAVSAVGGTVTVAEPVSVDDNGGSLTVDFTQPVSTITPYSRGSTAAADHFVWPSGVVRTDTLSTIAPAVNQYMGARCNSRGATWVKHDGLLTVDTSQLEDDIVVPAHPVFPAGAARDDTLGTLSVADGDWTDIRVNNRGALWIKPDGVVSVDDNAGSLTIDGTVTDVASRSAITQLHNAVVFNATLTRDSSSFAVGTARYLVLYLSITLSAGAPTDLRIIPQFSNDGGTTWFDWAVDQWTDLRYAAGQLPITEIIPLNYVVGTTFRLRGVSTGTTAGNTITLSSWVEAIS